MDHYVDLDATTKADLKLLKTALMEKAGLAQNPLTAGSCSYLIPSVRVKKLQTSQFI